MANGVVSWKLLDLIGPILLVPFFCKDICLKSLVLSTYCFCLLHALFLCCLGCQIFLLILIK